jgi:hypothetical protein
MTRTIYRCRGADIHDARLAQLLSERGYTVTARTEGEQ